MDWAEHELGKAELGDARRTKRLIQLAGALAARPEQSIAMASEGWSQTKAAYRLLSNEALEWREVLEVHTGRTVERLSGEEVVLCIQDTTELDFSSQPGIAGLGRLNYEARQGMYVHPTLLVTPKGVALGVVDAWMWARKPKGEVDVAESVRWVEGYGTVADLATRVGSSRLVYVTDREGDLRALMDEAVRREHVADWLVRARHNRKTEQGEKLWTTLDNSEALGEVEFTLPAAPGRAARRVRQSVYRERITLPAGAGAPAVTVTAIVARETQPPEGEKALEWRLLTNREAQTLDQVVELIDWYRRRWLIEVFFRILKSGCQVEALQLSTIERVERALVIYLIVAWRILQMVTWGREQPQLSCEVMFDPQEWQAAWIVAKRGKLPKTPPTLGEMVRLVAGFGGFLGRKHDGHPGPKALWTGMQRVQEFVTALDASRAMFDQEQ